MTRIKENEIRYEKDSSYLKSSKTPTNFDTIPKFDRDKFVFQTTQNNSDGYMANPMEPSLINVKELNKTSGDGKATSNGQEIFEEFMKD